MQACNSRIKALLMESVHILYIECNLHYFFKVKNSQQGCKLSQVRNLECHNAQRNLKTET